MKTQISLIPTDHCERMMNVALQLLAPAIKRSSGRWTIENVRDGLIEGREQLWLVFNKDKDIVAATTTMIQAYPNMDMLEIIFLGGVGFDEWSESSVNVLKNFAKDCGCDGIETIGRKGFLKPMKGRGFNTPYVVYENLFERKVS